MIMLLLLLVVLSLYCIGSVGIIWLICELVGWPFSVPVAIGVWLLANLAIGALKGVKRDDDGE